ncbi:Gfo/Idh/MocA family oxidoreductase [Halobacteria archaeon AArc-m2/3/4]|uniref:Gfo/Idh/MocA family oxidoreductase n=1 Tax=Natronoglomus mannanivorans TaxID=2979990 RepID=A0AAP2Z0S9_9EURY|nr:Gfo/Idh/MocA family oxidoreductase [Halobacteria archaeon AArc-xg1-1]MCU4973504.1 Gfo/Idh/MocA family oxidoreductase [Halobacteria archaeon AArc-m2/3/4]
MNETSETHRIAIAGVGAVAEMHALSIADVDGATLVAGSCRTASKGREFATEHDCDWYEDTETMLEESAPDVLIVCTPSGAHLEPTLAAADHGIDVLCEKPLEITTERIDRMMEAADEADITLGGVFQQRFKPLFQRVHDAAAADRFGSLSVANAYVPWWREDDYYDGAWQGTRELDGGGALMNQSIHGIDATQWLAGATMDLEPDENPVEEVIAYTDRLAHDDSLMEVEDTAVAICRYRDGTLGQFLGATSMYPGSLRRIQLAGREGTAEVLEDELVTWRFRDERDEDEELRERFGDESDSSGGAADPMAIDYSNHRRNVEAFLEACSSNDPYPLDATEARKAVAIIEAIYESAETGEPVRLE